MNTDFQAILKMVAEKNHTTPENVYHEMQLAIDDAFSKKDPESQKYWDMITIKGERPTPEEVVYGFGLILTQNTEPKQ